MRVQAQWFPNQANNEWIAVITSGVNLIVDGIEVEVHTLAEMEQALGLGARHIMLDNFTPAQVAQAAALKKGADCSIEISGGVNLDNLKDYLLTGVDAISIGRLTYGAPPVDISFKYQKGGR